VTRHSIAWTVVVLLAALLVVLILSTQPGHDELSSEPAPTYVYSDHLQVLGTLAHEVGEFLDSIPTTTVPLPLPSTTPTDIAPTVPEAKGSQPEAQGERWDILAQCESGGNWATNTGNGFGGGLQFMHQRTYSTWLSFGGGEYAPHPWDATREQQIDIAERVLASSGWGAWPGCSRRFGWL